MQTEIKVYAPVIIPTLNRDVHFKRCLESLERCTGADKTTVYVALDYPPSDKYADGWKKIDDYLKVKEASNGFGELIVIRRDHNFGVCHENGNYETLAREIKKQYDRYILSEDDNEFSSCFLEFQNKCLEKFKDDNRILKVCGYNFVMDLPLSFRNNFYISKSGSAWGVGAWTNKETQLAEYENISKLAEIIKDEDSYNTLKERYPRGISLIHSMLKLKKLHGDAIWEIYCALEDKYFVLPTLSKVRNFGNDGTGAHSLKAVASQNKFYSEQPIDENASFEFTDDVFTYEPVYLKRRNYTPKRTLRSFYRNLVCTFDIWLLRNFSYMPKSKYI